MTGLELLADESGRVVLGWLGAGTFYSRFEGTISSAIAERFAMRFGALIADTVGVHYFADSVAVVAYDLRAMAFIVDAVLAKRKQFKLITARPWHATLGPQAQAFAAAFGRVEYVTVAKEFEDRLCAVAPDVALDAASNGPSGKANAPAQVLDTVAAAAGARFELLPASAQEPTNYMYLFDLSDFEQGHFTAQRVEHLSAPSRGVWWCVATDDARALELARKAALTEWSLPASRRPENFVVKFVHVGSAGEQVLADRSRRPRK